MDHGADDAIEGVWAWTHQGIVEQIMALPATGALPRRTIVVPSPALASELARSLAATMLVGTRFVLPHVLAAESLRASGVSFVPGEEARRPARTLSLIRHGLALRYFTLDLLRTTRGWEDAFARTIGELEGAGMTAAHLLEVASTDREWDVAAIWRALDDDAAGSWTRERILGAATALEKPIDGSTLALISGAECSVERSFVRSIGAREVLLGANGAGAALPSMVLEEHASVDAEIEAAVRWVAREVLERRTPLADIAVLVPDLDPYASLLAARIGRLRLGAHVPRGLPLASTAAGARVTAVVRAIRDRLPADRIADLLPMLATEGRGHLTREDAVRVVSELGTIGGTAFHPEGAQDWASGLISRIRELEAFLASPAGADAREEPRRRNAETVLDPLRAIRTSLLSLVEVARAVHENRDLETIATALISFLAERLRSPGDGPHVARRLPLDELIAGDVKLRGSDALQALEATILRARVPVGRFGESRVFVGAIREAAGLEFRAVRIVGLVEGALPSPVREDVVLPDASRARVAPQAPRGSQRPRIELDDFARALRSCVGSVVLTTARSDIGGLERAPSSVLLDVPRVAAAVLEVPLAESIRLDHAAARTAVPFRWRREDAQVDALDDGVIGPVAAFPGGSADRPFTASMLRELLECPYRFLLERVLGRRESADLPGARDLGALRYGNLFHQVMEGIARAADTGETAVQAAAAAAVDELRRSWPLDDDARDAYAHRVAQDVIAFLRHEKGYTLVDAERAFGWDEPLVIEGLHVRGFIDRLDVQDGIAVVRDLKTGTPHPRIGEEASASPKLDSQIALYSLVARARAEAWGLPPRIAAAYVYAGPWGAEEREFRSDADALLESGERWMGIASGLLAAGLFPRTPRERDCHWCPFRPVCGPMVSDDGEAGPVARFLSMKANEP